MGETVEQFEEQTDHLTPETRADPLKVVQSIKRRIVGELTELFAERS